MKISFSKKVCFLAVGAILAMTACENSPYPGYEKSENGLSSKQIHIRSVLPACV